MYVTGVFNPQITNRKGVSFYALAAVPIRDAIQSPCTSVPTDLAVSLESVTAIPLQLTQTPVLHTELNLSEQIFRDYVLPLLQNPAGSFTAQNPAPAGAGVSLKPLQFSRIETGHINPGETRADLQAQTSLLLPKQNEPVFVAFTEAGGGKFASSCTRFRRTTRLLNLYKLF